MLQAIKLIDENQQQTLFNLPCFHFKVAVCNLASVALNKFVSDETPPRFDFQKLSEVTQVRVERDTYCLFFSAQQLPDDMTIGLLSLHVL